MGYLANSMAKDLSFREWEHLVITGKTKGVYFALLSFALFVVLILYNRSPILNFVGIEIGAFSSFGVLVDLVSHLFNDNYKSGLTKEEWVSRIRHGRTHDVYGLVVQAVSAVFAYRELILSVILWIAIVLELHYIMKARFYH